jgi:MFS family permease
MNNEAVAQVEEYPRWRAYYAYILLYLLYMFDYIDRFVIVSLFPFLKSDWGLSDAQCGMLVSAVFWSILVFTLPIGALVDRWSRKKSIGVMSIIWGLATAAGAVTQNFGQLFTTRCVVGVGEAGYVPGGAAIISAIFKPELRARMIGIWQSAIPLGQALGIAIGGIIAVSLGWRHALGIVAIPGLIIAIMFFWVKDYKTIQLEKSVPKADSVAKVKMSKIEVIKELFRSKSLVLDNFGVAACQFATVGLSTWLPAYIQRFEGMSIQSSGLMASVVMVLAIVGAPVGGVLTDLWLKKQSNARLLLPAITTMVAAILMFVAFSFHGNIQFAFLLAMGFFVIMFAPGAIAVTQDVVHPGLRSTSNSINIIIQHLLGSAMGPLVIGAVSDIYGLDVALKFIPIFLVVAGVLFFSGSFFYKKDLDAVEKVKIEFEPA